MFFKKYWFWIVISSIVVSWIGNSLYFESKQLDSPIFLTHYIEESIGNSTFLSIYYITNKSEHKELQMITMDGLTVYPQQPEDFFFMTGNQAQQPNYHQEFTHHYLKIATFEIHKDFLSPQQLKDGIDVKNIDAVFSEGPSITVPIGHIRLIPFNNTYEDTLRNSSSSSDSNGVNKFVHTASDALTIEQLMLPFGKELEGAYEIEVSKHHLENYLSSNKNIKPIPIKDWPVDLEESESLTTTIQYNMKSKLVLSLQFMLSGQTSTGKKFQVPFYTSQKPYLTQADINSYIERESEVN